MKLFYSPSSPFVRKCMVVAHELGLNDAIEKLDSSAHPVNRNATLVAVNPLGQVPTLVLEDGTALFDSRVICEYLDARAGGRLLPQSSEARARIQAEAALADGMLDAALLSRYELTVRPESARWQPWVDGQIGKIRSGLDWLEAHAAPLESRIDLATLAFACALGYLDFRFPHLAWRDGRPALARWFDTMNARPSMRLTMPPA